MHHMLIDLPERWETDRLILRPYRAGDGAAYYDVCIGNREHLLPYEAGNPALLVQSVDDAEILVRNFAAHWAKREAFFIGAWEKANASFAAQLYVGPVNWDLPEFEVGYFADVDHLHQGFVTEGLSKIIAYLFEGLGAHRIRLGCNEMNEPSWRVAERCGFMREGHLRGTHKDLLRPDGSCSGDYLYGLLRDEFMHQRSLSQASVTG